ncbi:hypothetical protein E4U30_002399 [Claviceps sp. LM220 group G6]|nr:hypothetical protein E4U15_007213 [Claviceps sp. LM218 group G6]KAG6095525.1 hypothetical protein E4U30_002399 [Claviceps sp. LM220 group G6]KAG6105828.1 hypothetical protein E4U31_001199 [Claviceps sp. LM219 group G6]
MSGLIVSALRGSSLLWTLLITALIGNVIDSNINASSSASAAVNFTMFVAVLSWIVHLYGLAAVLVSSLSSGMILLPMDILITLFTFIDAIVLAAKLRAPNCSNIDPFSLPASWVGYGSDDNEKRCREIQASTAFMWFLFASSAVVLLFSAKDARGGFGGSTRSSKPNMSQVGV